MVKNPPANAGDMGFIPGLGRSPGEGNGNPLQYSCLGNPMDREAWQATVLGVAGNRTRLSNNNTVCIQIIIMNEEIPVIPLSLSSKLLNLQLVSEVSLV